MTKATRKTYTSAFKAKVDLEAIRATRTVNEIAQDFEVHPAQVAKWKKEIQDRATTLFDTKRGPKKSAAPAATDADNLFAEIGRLKVGLIF